VAGGTAAAGGGHFTPETGLSAELDPNPSTPSEAWNETLVPTLNTPVDAFANPSQLGGWTGRSSGGLQGLRIPARRSDDPKEPPLKNADAEGSQPLVLGRTRELDNENPAYRPKHGSSSVDLVSALRDAQASWAQALQKPLNALQEDGYSYQTPWWYYKGALFVPPEPQVRRLILTELHDTPYQGHKGVARTVKAAGQIGVNWPGMVPDIKAFVNTCASCQRAKPYPHKNAGVMVSHPVAEGPWSVITIDFITQLPSTMRGHDAILVVVDKFSKYTILIPCTPHLTAIGCAQLLHDHVFCVHGWPRDIVSDRDVLFTSGFWQTFMSLQGTNLAMSTAFHPQTDGQTERQNRTLEDMLRHYVGPDQRDWDDWLKVAQFAINNAHTDSIGMTPHYLLFGAHPNTPFHLALLKHCAPVADPKMQNPSAVQLSTALQERVELARQYLHAARDRQQARADQVRVPVKFNVGDQVLLHTQHFTFKSPKGALVRKLLPRWIGPFPVVQCVGQVAYKLQLPVHLRVHPVFHVSKLKPYHSDGRIQPPPVPLIIDGQEEYVVDMVHAHRDVGSGSRKVRQYLVRWAGYTPEHDTWEPERNLSNAQDMVDAYWSRARVLSKHRS